ncbi:alkaline shock response membrane anchor protein AmaP [Marinococcus halotolerans]|uniref:alkaline shock response membrane anchor protein AmaP n=1 Tax=Marinococcus halotolerans TaxID=301092 RepID=UPI0003B351B0|nr:alkaline shock response membrane anchor protein AmaP [Marinococcus halotolerans]
MNGLTRIIGLLFAFVTIVFTTGALLYVFELGASTAMIDGWLGDTVGFWIIIGMAIFIGIISIGILITSLTRSSPSSDGFHIETSDGTIEITRASIRSMVHQTLKEYRDLRAPEVIIQIPRKQDAINIRTSFHLFRETEAQTLTKEIQQRVKDRVEAWLEVPVRDVRVTVHEPKVDKKKARVV